MKKVLKIVGIVILSIFLLLIIVPLAVKDKMAGVITKQANKYLDATLSLDAVNISLLRNFPNATVTIKGVELVGKGDFAQDTLISSDRIMLTMNLASLFKGSGFDIVRVTAEGTDVKAIVLEDGRPNWDIMLPSDEQKPEEPEAEEEPSEINVKLNKLIFKDINIVYDDRQGGMYAALRDLGLTLSGDMTADHATLSLDLGIESTDFRYGGVPYLSRTRLALESDIDADMAANKYTLKENKLSVNAIQAAIDGWVQLLDPEGFDMDLSLRTGSINFKEILSLIPAVYMKDFKNLQATGNVSLGAMVKGRMVGDMLPAFTASVQVDNGTFRYPALPKGLDGIYVKASASSNGGSADNTVVDVQNFQFTLDGNPFKASAHLTTPISDPAFNVKANGKINLASVADIYPMEDTKLQGLFEADLALDGRMSYIDKGQYEKMSASGTLAVSGVELDMKDMPAVKVQKAVFGFSPRWLHLSETSLTVGRSDLKVDCKLENYVPYLMKGETIRGSLTLKSNLLDLNEFMGGEPTNEAELETPATEGSGMSAPKVPDNINFDMNVALGKVLVSNMKLDNVKGRVVVAGSKLDMKGLSFNTLGGSVTANGYYSTASGVSNPELNAAFGMNGVGFRQTFNTFVTVQKLAPIFEGLGGSFSGNLSINTRMDSLLNPRFETMNGKGTLSTKEVGLSGIGVIDKIADAVKKPELKNMKAKDIRLSLEIIKGRVHTQPFDLKMGDVNLNLSGSTGLDQTIDYKGKIKLPESTGIGKYTTLDLTIGGTFGSPKVGVDMKSMAAQATEVVKDQVLDKLGEKLGIDISDAEKQRDALIDQARKAGDKLIAEAQKQSDKLVEEAGSNPIKKAAAKAAGKALVDTAEKQAKNLVDKATQEGDKLVEKAKAKE